ncbi:RNA pseudouridine synthase [Colwellia sp. 1_MG-2023]|uniref:RluA family pseudouridine synthase n=1 Tax=Colwellia sp. 1_MG-2023 TaxID=3062649 RepID=UPI0026E3AF7E|nr:RNA pseudouridine synthase [Colwellia sp. 1_MG-2023]MDO6445845.1 RNA pseudouridine synthase [Colwellia sp. 1_MG-2023]
MIRFERHINVTADNLNILELLAQSCCEFSLSNAKLKDAINKGALWLSRGKYTQRIRKVKKSLQQHDVIHFYYDEKVLSQQPPQAQLIADLQQYSVWYKPYGLLSQGSKWSDHCTIARWAETQLLPQRPAFIVHRLDRAASGLIIIAHSKKMAQAFSQIFENHQLAKIYQIIVHGVFPDNLDKQTGLVVTTNIDDKRAKSTFFPQEVDQQAQLSLVKVNIETGRKHQIRKHAASINLPVVGDRLHGDQTKKIPETVNLQLCAVELQFTCPVSQTEKHFELPSQLTLSLTNLVKTLS